MNKLSGKKILLAVTGSIAAYKAAWLVRLFIKQGAEVKVVMTSSACDFITPLTLSTLSKNPVLTDLVDAKTEIWNNHVQLGLWADVMVVAPASANTIAKFASGICDNLITAVYLSARCKVAIAPAMDEDMLNHPSVQKNLSTLQAYGNLIIPVGEGELASGLVGPGRMAEPEAVAEFVSNILLAAGAKTQKKKLSGKRALVTAGPTYEAIDPVRFIGNHSSGKMGIAIAEALASQGAAVTLILGPSSFTPRHPGITVQQVTSAKEMYEATTAAFPGADISILSAAVADFTPEKVSENKIKKGSKPKMKLTLVRTKDILGTLGKSKKRNQLLVGFALETNNEVSHAKEKLRKKNLDFIVLNSLKDEGAGFKHDTNRISIIDRHEKVFHFPLKTKQEVATDIVNFILKKIS